MLLHAAISCLSPRVGSFTFLAEPGNCRFQGRRKGYLTPLHVGDAFSWVQATNGHISTIWKAWHGQGRFFMVLWLCNGANTIWISWLMQLASHIVIFLCVIVPVAELWVEKDKESFAVVLLQSLVLFPIAWLVCLLSPHCICISVSGCQMQVAHKPLLSVATVHCESVYTNITFFFFLCVQQPSNNLCF